MKAAVCVLSCAQSAASVTDCMMCIESGFWQSSSRVEQFIIVSGCGSL